MNLPTKSDINVYNSPDENTAIKHYYNKTLEEIEALYQEYGLTYCQDLMWMGPTAFSFYLQAVIRYLQSDNASGDADVINCLAAVIEYRCQEKEFSMAVNRVHTIIDYVINNYKKFEVDSSIYGDLLEKYKQLQRYLTDKQ